MPEAPLNKPKRSCARINFKQSEEESKLLDCSDFGLRDNETDNETVSATDMEKTLSADCQRLKLPFEEPWIRHVMS